MKQKKKKKTVKKPNFFLYYFIAPLLILWYKSKVKLIKNKEKIEKGSIILAPHRSYYDFMTVPIAVYPKRVHVISTTYWFRNKKLARLLNILGVIPKDQYRSDVKAILKMAEVLKRKENILIFPEGQMSPYGKSLFLPNGLDKLIYKYKPNVYFVSTNGAYLNSPKWNSKLSKHAVIEANTLCLFKSDEIENYTVDDINKKINEVFKGNNDFEWVKENPHIKFIRKDKAVGLENVLLYCPECMEVLPFESESSKVKCKNCGYELEFTKESFDFKDDNKYKNLGDLFDDLNNIYKEKIQNNLVLNDNCRVTFYDSTLTENEMFNGTITMDNENIILKGNDNEEIIIENKKIINLVITLNKSLEIPTSEKTYKIYLENPRRSILYWDYLEILKENI